MLLHPHREICSSHELLGDKGLEISFLVVSLADSGFPESLQKNF